MVFSCPPASSCALVPSYTPVSSVCTTITSSPSNTQPPFSSTPEVAHPHRRRAEKPVPISRRIGRSRRVLTARQSGNSTLSEIFLHSFLRSVRAISARLTFRFGEVPFRRGCHPTKLSPRQRGAHCPAERPERIGIAAAGRLKNDPGPEGKHEIGFRFADVQRRAHLHEQRAFLKGPEAPQAQVHGRPGI